MKKLLSHKDVLLQILRKNRKGVSRKELKELMHLDDRVIRGYIAELRDEGHMIGITADGGYSLNKSRDFDRAIALFQARQKREAKRLKAMIRTRELKDQVRLNV